MMTAYPRGPVKSSLRRSFEGHPGPSWYDTAVMSGNIMM